MKTYKLVELEKAIVIAAKEFCDAKIDNQEIESSSLKSFSNQLCIEQKVKEWIQKVI